MLTVTTPAAQKISELLNENLQAHPQGGIRVGTILGGCAGIRYTLTWEVSPKSEDVVVQLDGAAVFVAPESSPYLEGTIIDFVSASGGGGFTFDNPNAVGRCSCSNPDAPCAQ